MKPRLLAAFFLLGLAASSLLAQTYRPKQIRFTGAEDQDRTELLKVLALTPGQPITREQIEAGLGRLADTGDFSDLSYSVNGEALTIQLTAAASAQPMPVRFANFIWWSDAELEHQLETRVPGFHGKLAQRETQQEAVKNALVAFAREKGLDITVELVKSRGTFVLEIDHPAILSGKLTVDEVEPVVGSTFAELKRGLNGQEFDKVFTPDTITHDTAEIYRNAGYLDVTVDPPVFSAPRQESGSYRIDASATVHPGAKYTLHALTITANPPFDQDTLRSASGLKTGEPAAPMLYRLASFGIQSACSSRGYLAAKVDPAESKDASTHTVSDTFSVDPGPLFHLTRISVYAGLPDALGAALQQDAHLHAGVVADANVLEAARNIIRQQDLAKQAMVGLEPDAANATAILVVKPVHTKPAE